MSEKEKAPKKEKLDVAPKTLGKLLCVYTIKENGEVWPAGVEYTGKNGKKLLEKGAIKRV